MGMKSNHLLEEPEMAFINEHIPPADLVKYDIERIDKSHVMGGTSARDWTIDRDRDIYIREVSIGREEFASRSTWTLYWRGTLIPVDIDVLSAFVDAAGDARSHKRVLRIDIPQHLSSHRREILDDLRDALVAYKDAGVFSKTNNYQLTLDI
jgi:hypothetical protein